MLMGAILRAAIAGSSQMLGLIGAVVNPDVHADDPALEAGTEVRPSQPPHPSLIVDVLWAHFNAFRRVMNIHELP